MPVTCIHTHVFNTVAYCTMHVFHTHVLHVVINFFVSILQISRAVFNQLKMTIVVNFRLSMTVKHIIRAQMNIPGSQGLEHTTGVFMLMKIRMTCVKVQSSENIQALVTDIYT